MDILGILVIVGASIYATDVLRKKYNRTRHAQVGHRVVNTVTNQQQAQNQAAGGTQGAGTQQTTAGNQQTQGGGTQKSSWRSFFSNLSFPHIPLWVWGIGLALVALKFFGKDLPWTEIFELAREHWVIVLLACVFFTGMFVGDKEDAAKLTKAVIIGLLIFVGLKYGGKEVLKLNYGPEYKEVLQGWQKENIAKAKGLSKQGGGSATIQGRAVTITASDTEWTEPLRVTGQYCFAGNVVRHGLPGLLAQVSSKEHPSEDDWIDATGRQQVSIAWVRYRSKGPGQTEIQHELRPKGQCN